VLQTSTRTAYDENHAVFRDQIRKFFDQALTPNLARWEQEGIVDRDFWRACGEAGLLCPTLPEQYGGLGLDFGYNAVIGEELAYAGSSAGVTLQSDIVADYILNYG
jgi:acyl-CoA dehydrogenase